MIHYRDESVEVHFGDCLDVLAELPDASVDSVVCDPPYGLDFMGKHWDTGAVAFDTAIWGHALRVLKPGGHVLAFGGSRTWHRLAVAIEDAGFEIRDSIAWLYGSGFPKSLDVSKAIDKAAGAERERIPRIGGALNSGTANGWAGSSPDSQTAQLAGTQQVNDPATDAAKQWQGWGTALKPAFEPIVVGRKPIRGTVAANVVAHGTGALNIDGCRVATDEIITNHSRGAQSAISKGVYGDSAAQETHQTSGQAAGRWPTNVVLDESQADELDKQSGVTVSTGGSKSGSRDSGLGFAMAAGHPIERPTDQGGASRFFPTFRYEAKAPSSERPSVNGIAHPTVKPLELMRWLVRLVTPPHGLVLDPFAGSGTTAEACVQEHMRCITIEREADYLPLIVSRLSKPVALGFDFDENAC